jgi:ABC-type nitrate/sulfonate/bicarbonate transport system substrate-binding protein
MFSANRTIKFFAPVLIIAATLFAMSGVPATQVAAAVAQATEAPTQAATEGAIATASAPTSVNIILDYTPNTNHNGIYVAQAKGYYKDANLNVTIQENDGSVQAEQVVATGKAQFGVSYQEQATYSRADGVPIVSIAAIIQHNTSGFAAMHDKHPLKTPADLAGLRYGSFGSEVEKPMLDILTQCAGASADKIEFDNIGFADPLPLMEKDRIDFVWLFYGWDGLRAKEQNTPLDFIMLHDYTQCVPDYYTPLLITNEDMIARQPDVVRAFTQATARGYVYSIQHPDEAADILLKAAPELDPTLVKESSTYLAGQFQADAPQWGVQKTEIWQGFTDFLVKNGALKAPIDVKAAFTNDFLASGK